MSVPPSPKIYHIVHIDRLSSIISDGFLWCDDRMSVNPRPGTTIGLSHIKQRRLRNSLESHPGLQVGDCVPFYFCPRSVMLYLIHRRNGELAYQDGQTPIIHLEADLRRSVQWADANRHRWAFTLSNAGSLYFEDRKDLNRLGDLNWSAIQATHWSNQELKEGKQAEFLMEDKFPWHLVEAIGVYSMETHGQVLAKLPGGHPPRVTVRRDWYY